MPDEHYVYAIMEPISFCTTDGDPDAVACGPWYPVLPTIDGKFIYNFNASTRYRRSRVTKSGSSCIHPEDMGLPGSMVIGPSGASVVRGGTKIFLCSSKLVNGHQTFTSPSVNIVSGGS